MAKKVDGHWTEFAPSLETPTMGMCAFPKAVDTTGDGKKDAIGYDTTGE